MSDTDNGGWDDDDHLLDDILDDVNEDVGAPDAAVCAGSGWDDDDDVLDALDDDIADNDDDEKQRVISTTVATAGALAPAAEVAVAEAEAEIAAARPTGVPPPPPPPPRPNSANALPTAGGIIRNHSNSDDGAMANADGASDEPRDNDAAKEQIREDDRGELSLDEEPTGDAWESDLDLDLDSNSNSNSNSNLDCEEGRLPASGVDNDEDDAPPSLPTLPPESRPRRQPREESSNETSAPAASVPPAPSSHAKDVDEKKNAKFCVGDDAARVPATVPPHPTAASAALAEKAPAIPDEAWDFDDEDVDDMLSFDGENDVETTRQTMPSEHPTNASQPITKHVLVKRPSPPPPPSLSVPAPTAPPDDEDDADHREEVLSSLPPACDTQEPVTTRIEDTSFATVAMGNLSSRAKDNIAQNNNHDDDEDDNDDGGGGWSDDDFFDDEDDNKNDSTKQAGDDMASFKSPHVSAAPTRPPPYPSNIPPLSSHDSRPPPSTQHRHSTPLPPPPPPPPSIDIDIDLNPTQRRIFQMLSGYVSTLEHPEFIDRLHRQLRLHQTRSTPRPPNDNDHVPIPYQTTAAARELRNYFATRPGLRKYTLGVELTRMEYELILPNGRRTDDKDVIRSYFGVGEDGSSSGSSSDGGDADGDPDAVTPEELLIRSANQSLLADALVALTVSEEDVIDSKRDGERWGLILSGPMLCMTSVAETCRFQVDLQTQTVEAVCNLAIGVPYHHGNSSDKHRSGDAKLIDNGRLLLARANVSVRFRPGGEGGRENDEPTVQYAVRSITPHHSPDSHLLRNAAISLARDHEDPFFRDDYAAARRDESTTDARDFFLISHHLLSDSRLLAVSDHFVRLRGAAEAGSTGFRSALQQLDGVTNVSGKFQFLRATAGAAAGDGNGRGGGFGGFGFSLPSAEDIEAAEREAEEAASLERARGRNAPFAFDRGPYHAQELMQHHLPPPDHHRGQPFDQQHPQSHHRGRPFSPNPPQPPPPPSTTTTTQHGQPTMQKQQPPPPPPPPLPRPTQSQQDRPRPIIGGLFMSGLSRLAAAATEPDNNFRNENTWDESGGTGLTPPASPKQGFQMQNEANRPVLYRREEDIVKTPFGSDYDKINQSQDLPNLGVESGSTGSILGRRHDKPLAGNDVPSTGPPHNSLLDATHFSQEIQKNVDEDVGWSDDELDFDDEGGEDSSIRNDDNQETVHEEHKECALPKTSTSVAASSSFIDHNFNSVVIAASTPVISESAISEQPTTILNVKEQQTEPDRSKTSPTSYKYSNERVESTMPTSNAFEEEFTLIMKDRVEAEMKEMERTGRMRRWRPIREDPIARQRLMKVMLSHIQ